VEVPKTPDAVPCCQAVRLHQCYSNGVPLDSRVPGVENKCTIKKKYNVIMII
jgi:hypothetical protein